MNGRDTSSQRPGVVLLTRDVVLASWLRYLCAPSVRLVSVASGYEAAAEILASPTEILVIDLRAMSCAHQRLLDTARGLGMQILGLGKVPSDLAPDALSRVRLVSQADLPKALSECLSPAPATTAAAAAPAAAPAGTPPAPKPPAPTAPSKDRPAEPARKQPAKRARLVPKSAPAAAPQEQPAHPVAGPAAASPPKAEAQPPRHEPPTPRQPSDLLTPEEVAALLESDL